MIDCSVGERKHDIAEQWLAETNITQGLFLILIGRAQAPAWDIRPCHHLERKKPMPYVNHHSFHILDPEWGHITLKISGHLPFPVQAILNGHEHVACEAKTILGYAAVRNITEQKSFLVDGSYGRETYV